MTEERKLLERERLVEVYEGPITEEQKALSCLRHELLFFKDEGLERLHDDLKAGKVPGDTWWNCPLSYAGGEPGSVDVDHEGCETNHFTVEWDGGYLKPEQVLEQVEAELSRRASGGHRWAYDLSGEEAELTPELVAELWEARARFHDLQSIRVRVGDYRHPYGEEK